MQSGDLVAFIPVNHDMAVKKGWGKMPFPSWWKELNARTQGRLVQADKDYQPPTGQSKGKGVRRGAQVTGGPNDRKAVLRVDDADELTRGSDPTASRIGAFAL